MSGENIERLFRSETQSEILMALDETELGDETDLGSEARDWLLLDDENEEQ